MTTVTAYDWVPPFAQGHVRDLRVRWALNEAGREHAVELIPQGQQTQPHNLARQPFGQVPAFSEDGDTWMFESGAICWTIAEGSDALLSHDPVARAHALSWTFAAVNSVEPTVSTYNFLKTFAKDRESADRLLPEAEALLTRRLSRLSDALSNDDWLVANTFCVADLTMVCVLRPVPDALLERYPNLMAYRERGIARPAFQAALAAQMLPFTANTARYTAA